MGAFSNLDLMMKGNTPKPKPQTAAVPFWMMGQPAQANSAVANTATTPVQSAPVAELKPIVGAVQTKQQDVEETTGVAIEQVVKTDVVPAVETIVEEQSNISQEQPITEVAGTEEPEPVDEEPDDDDDSEDEKPEAKKAETLSPEEKKRQHEESEAKRKAEWEAKQAEKKAKEEQAMAALDAMSDTEIATASAKRIGDDTERLTRRNMKDCVTAHIQERCQSDLSFARKAMHPRKNMINCFKYITRLALEYIKKEMEDNGEPQIGYGMGSDVPDDLCYEWAEEYFLNSDVEEDKDKDAEFVPKPYSGPQPKTKKTAAKKEKKPEKPKEEKKADGSGQLSLLEQFTLDNLGTEKKAS